MPVRKQLRTVASTTVNNSSNARTADDSSSNNRLKKWLTKLRELIDRLLLERLSLAGIARAVGISQQWLQTYVSEKYAKVPCAVQVTPQKRGG